MSEDHESLLDQIERFTEAQHAADPLLADFERELAQASRPRYVHEALMWTYNPRKAEKIKRARRRALLHRYMGKR